MVSLDKDGGFISNRKTFIGQATYPVEISLHLCLERKTHPSAPRINSEPTLKLPEVSRKLLVGPDSILLHKASRAHYSLSLLHSDRNRLPWSIPVKMTHQQDLGHDAACPQWFLSPAL